MLSVSAALSAKSASNGEPESKRQQTEIDAAVKSMSADNQAVFMAVTGYMDQKMDKRLLKCMKKWLLWQRHQTRVSAICEKSWTR